MRFELRETSDGSLTVFDREAGECFKSRHAARLEAEHVFYAPGVLEHGSYGAPGFETLELGFGLGTNFLHFLSRGYAGGFTSIERDLAGARFFLENGEKDRALRELVDSGGFQTEKMRARIRQGDFFGELRALAKEGYRTDAVLFDPFSPKANPEAWTSELFALVFALLRPQGRLVTYSVSRVAKDAAAAAGFLVEKRELPSALRKRSALLAIRPQSG
jgi:tRNA U34 5-methylaminomethyl-2-thiouridine-forming methyltransferase MnmC